MQSALMIKKLNSLIEHIKSINYETDEHRIPLLVFECNKVFEKFFGKDSIHIDKLDDVSFYPLENIFSHYNEEINIFEEQYFAFESGKTSMINVLEEAIKDIELDEELSFITSTLPLDTKITEPTKSNKVFIVHGHDDGLKNDVARFVEKLGFEAIILHEQANAGNTIIEKIEKNSDVGFAIVLYTPCDEGKPKSSEQLRNRARQNVVFEHGFFIAKLGRANVVALHKGEDLELPNDISGVVYIKYESGAWKYEIAKEMVSSGYDVNFMKI